MKVVEYQYFDKFGNIGPQAGSCWNFENRTKTGSTESDSEVSAERKKRNPETHLERGETMKSVVRGLTNF